eukprot:TCONS_00028212-protein
MDKLRMENDNLKKYCDFEKLKSKLQSDVFEKANEVKELRKDIEMLKLTSENALLKAEKQFGIEKDVLVAEKMTLEQDVKTLKAENEELKENKRDDIEKRIIEMKKSHAEILKFQNENREIAKNNGIMECEIHKFDQKIDNLMVENKRLKDELEITKNTLDELEIASQKSAKLVPDFMKTPFPDLVEFTLYVLDKEEHYPHYEKMFQALNYDLISGRTAGEVLIFRLAFSSKILLPDGCVHHLNLRDRLRKIWNDIKCVRILHPTDNRKSIVLEKRCEEGLWNLEINYDFAVNVKNTKGLYFLVLAKKKLFAEFH